jgi:NADH:ubiquinone reductase (H+-translocating)
VKTKKIIVLGAGFGGLHTALDLTKHLRGINGYEIILVDKRDVHLYTPDLYEIATAYREERTEECRRLLTDTVAIPIDKLINKKPITFIKDIVEKIDVKARQVVLGSQKINYEYLVLALGSVINYHDISGMSQFSYPLKSISDALAIQCHIDIYFQALWRKGLKKEVNIIVGGGGATGVEVVGELVSYVDKLCEKYDYPRESVNLSIVQGSDELIGMGKEMSDLAIKRLSVFGVDVVVGHYIDGVTIDTITLKDSKDGTLTKRPVDMLIWTGGVKPNELISQNFEYTSNNGAIELDKHLETIHYPGVYGAGDCTQLLDPKTGMSAPLLAQVAFEEGRFVATNIAADIKGHTKKAYKPDLRGVILPVCGKYALFKRGNSVYGGYIFWVLRRLVDLYYTMSIMPFGYALKKWLYSNSIFAKNDRR